MTIPEDLSLFIDILFISTFCMSFLGNMIFILIPPSFNDMGVKFKYLIEQNVLNDLYFTLTYVTLKSCKCIKYISQNSAIESPSYVLKEFSKFHRQSKMKGRAPNHGYSPGIEKLLVVSI